MDRFTIPKLEERVKEIGRSVYWGRMPVQPLRWRSGWPEGADAPEYADGDWEAVTAPFHWGGRDVKGMLRCRFTVPAEWAGARVALRVALSEGLHVSGPDATAYIDGKARQGVDIHHGEVLLSPDLMAGEHVLALEAYSGTRPGRHLFGGVELVAIDETARALYYDARTALDAARLLDETSLDRAHIVNALDRAILKVDFREPLGPGFRLSLEGAREVLRRELYGREWPGDRPKVVAVGHAHIDVAWLWTLEHTRKKTGRTFLTALRLMEQFPEYRFLQSQPHLYEFFRRDYPEHYPEVRARIAEGRWEATGGMWVEADSNASSGESLVRQVLFGKRHMRRELGVEARVLWLPDAFGYSWALPQIMARSGIDYFMTTKISWNEFNKLPYDTFRWQGIDGTQILTHFITTPSESWFATYNGKLTPFELKGTWDQYKQKRLNSELLLAFGYGDGGGGPTADMLETAQRMKNLPGMPRLEIGSATDFFDRLSAKTAAFPVWNDELYLEFHRGTFTSQARTKRYNRKAEVQLHNAEALAAIDHLHGGPYPSERLNQAWELVLLNQFHDILPGSSIGEVYEESNRQYEEVLALGRAVQQEAVDRMAAQIAGEAESVVVHNTLGWSRSDVVEVEAPAAVEVTALRGPDGGVEPVQRLGDGKRLLVHACDIPAYGWACLELARDRGPAQGMPLSATPQVLESPFFRVALDAAGRITSLVDKRYDREVIAEGAVGNEFVLFEDKPLNNDAWNIDVFYEEKQWRLDEAAGVRVTESGPVRAGVEWRRSFRDSSMSQRIYVYAKVPRIDFETWVDWHEKHTLMKVAFPVTVHSSRATYEIQFGAIERATHRNTSWDYARFEVAAQRWADLSEGDYGVSLLNDCKYGYDVHGNVMRLTLLKSATSPDPEADQGEHRFTYSLLPHEGDWRHGTVRQAASLNLPLLAAWQGQRGGSLPASWSLVRASSENLVIDTVKKAEDEDALIVRVYDAHGQRGRGTLRFGRRIASASECNLLEEEDAPVRVEGSDLTFDYKPYQIRTMKVRLV